jgi:hypothetical protein
MLRGYSASGVMSREPSGCMRRPSASRLGCEGVGRGCAAPSTVDVDVAAVVPDGSGVAPISFKNALSSESACSLRAVAEEP